jgi:hypothetical protein
LWLPVRSQDRQRKICWLSEAAEKNQSPFFGEQEALQPLHFRLPFDGLPAPLFDDIISPS